MKIQILVLSCAREPYASLCAAQRRTWDSVEVPSIETTYYFSDSIAEMPERLKKSLPRDPYDFIFRTNASSYIDKAQLVAKAESLPRERCYCGIDGGGFASGSGFFLSPDCAEILRRDLPDRTSEIEDVAIGECLARAGVGVTPGADRYDWHARSLWHLVSGTDLDLAAIRAAYHLRCKGAGVDRDEDVAVMETIHGIKTA